MDFRWQHLGLSTPAASFDEVNGHISWDAEKPASSSVEVSMPVRSVRTRVPGFDADFISSEFFDAAQFPDIRFCSTEVTRVVLGNRFRVRGELTVKGITKPVTLEAVLNGQGIHPMLKRPVLGFDALGVIRRSDYGMPIALPDVSDEVAIRITVEAIGKEVKIGE
ncbi:MULTISPECIES: YceI family protein [Comamonas]|uniref:YceI family protein n=1 Tax=Comamonas TaxID=283 RepID=UPI0006830722|nr:MULTISPECIES: YceI family protein [Comamonas]